MAFPLKPTFVFALFTWLSWPSANLHAVPSADLLAAGDAAGNVTVVSLDTGAVVATTNLNLTAIAHLDLLDVDGDARPEILATHMNSSNTPTYCLSLPKLVPKWQTDRNTQFSWCGYETLGGPRVWAGDFARDGVLKLLIPFDYGSGTVCHIFRAADGTLEDSIPGPENWIPVVYLDPVDSHWKAAVEFSPNVWEHPLACYDLTAKTFLWTNSTVNTWLLGAVGNSMLDGQPRIWGGWYGRTLYVVDRNGNNLWQKSFGGGWEASAAYAGNLRGDGTEALLVGGTYGWEVHIDATRLLDGATLWTFVDPTAYWSGHAIAVEDVQGDGVKEVFLYTLGDEALARQPKFQALNGADGSRLWQISYPYDAWMLTHARFVDVNGDGRKDVLLAVNNTIEAHDALTGALLKTFAFPANVTAFEISRLNSPADLIQALINAVEGSSLPANRKTPLLATLHAAAASCERGDVTTCANQLRAFQNKVNAQIPRIDPALAEEWIMAAQQIIEALDSPRPSTAY